MAPDSLLSFLSLALGFALAGMAATGYQLATDRPLSFRLVAAGARAIVPAVAMLAVAAPFLIMRNTIRGRQIEQRPLPSVMAATILAGLWSLMSGTVVVMVLQALLSL